MRARGRWLAALAASALAIALAAACPAGAAAGGARFVFEQCDPALPYAGIPAYGFAAFAGESMVPFQTCSSARGGFGILQAPAGESGSAGLSLAVPATPGGFVEAETITAFTQGLGTGAVASVLEAGFPPTDGKEWARTFKLRSGPGAGGGDGEVSVALACPGGVGACGYDAGVFAHFIAATEVDPDAPVVGLVGEGLVGGGVVYGSRDLFARAHDEGGGVSQMTLRVNGMAVGAPVGFACHTAVADNPSVAGVVAISPTPCPASVEEHWHLDTTTAPFRDGPNSVSVCAQDFATLGAPNEGCASAEVWVDNSCPEAGAAGAASVEAHLAGRGGESETVAFGTGTQIRGRVLGPGGAPVAGARVCIAAQTEGSAGGYGPTQTATTDGEGRFTYQLAPGPDREIRVLYRQGTTQLERALRVDSHARAALRARPRRLGNGRRVRFSGRLPGPDARGRVVVLQANVKGSARWITFRRAETDAGGAFRATYHFHSTTRPTLYRFRAIVPRQEGYPYREGRSRAVEVLVDPHRRASRHRRSVHGRGRRARRG